MAHIIIDKSDRCTCDQASTCALMHKSGSSPRCTAKELEDAGHAVVRLTEVKSVFKKRVKYLVESKKRIYNL